MTSTRRKRGPILSRPKPIVKMPPAVASVLPLAARNALIAAAAVDASTPLTESQERTNVLDHTTRNIRMKYPQFFK